MNIWVDADACPNAIKDILYRAADRVRVPLTLVANHALRTPPSRFIRSVQVPGGFDVADNRIVKELQAGDLVVTADIPLAARCLKSGARVLGATGKPFTEDSIGMALAMRDLKAHLRETGEIKGHVPNFTKQDRSRFLSALEEAIQALRRRQPVAR